MKKVRSEEAKMVEQVKMTYPSADETVSKWLCAQHNISASLRMLIKFDAARYGYTDATCRSFDDIEPAGKKKKKDVSVQVTEPSVQQVVKKEAPVPAPVKKVQPEPEPEVITKTVSVVSDNTDDQAASDMLMDMLNN